ncbi:HAD-IA family hydrolase [Natranaerobius thermophilus]|uniref:HAD-superfamily hydrolase, subfamily IA, variant 1 n=1 Tax=Natranaerobius thermophilus (strain ATCC BAA-1301 / DSM 18059 / JW/NM-WN-LF) TaxID=457570 RepID=B2A6N3_NATTJ|nr:HAD-IA family hydrolase [Natranaerobius thermophilus]ACB84166.1 HAD-superfamily hydrolase, subfamily IA, variant 1 [Natranaerobius thermophilus JW/NM-WN-LF]
MSSKVSIAQVGCQYSDDIIAAKMKQLFFDTGLNDYIAPNKQVLIKPNLVAVPPEDFRGAITHPLIVQKLSDIVRSLGGQVIIGDSSAVGVNTEDVISTTGYEKLRQQGYQVIDLKQDSVVDLQVPGGGKALSQLPVAKTVKDVDLIISVPVMKTHDQVEVSLSIKNLKGLLPDKIKKAFHNKYGLAKGVSDILATVPPVVSVLDATYALEGMGPVYGESVPMGLILASSDPVALDSIAAGIMGLEEDELKIEGECYNRCLGELRRDKITISGDVTDIDQVARRFTRIKDLDYQFNVDFDLIFNEEVCTGCKNTVMSSLDDIQTQGVEPYLSGKTVYAGPLTQGEISGSSNSILIGNCLYKHKSQGTFVPGCPPENLPVIEGLVGEGKIARRYTSENQSQFNHPWGIIYDLDNTLINSKINFNKMKVEVMNYLQEEQLLPEITNLEKHTAATLIQTARQHSTLDQEQEDGLWALITAIEAEGMDKAETEPDINEVISTLANEYTLIVLTNNSYKAAMKALKQFGLDEYFQLVVGREQMTSLKPSPSGAEYILEHFGDTKAEDWVMVGDSWIDAKAAQDASIPFLAYNCNLQELIDRDIPWEENLKHPWDIINYLDKLKN